MPEHIRQEPKVLVSTENLTEQEWLAYRRRGIGGSDVAAILGISPFRTARDLYDDKLNIALAVDDAGNWVALEMGHLLEPLVAPGWKFSRSRKCSAPAIPSCWQMWTTLFGQTEKLRCWKSKRELQAKDHWWKHEECVPIYYETQGRHYMAVMDMDEIFLSVWQQ